ncbi:tetratricopeptide repeat protein [Kitasatospora sp. NPDC088134]|uniref:tetratricopeptide repeat protein n=1 Tax=Kitasatospora sp. NPDC088134 TaxID=3364071 RepID=UPI00382B1E53
MSEKTSACFSSSKACRTTVAAVGPGAGRAGEEGPHPEPSGLTGLDMRGPAFTRTGPGGASAVQIAVALPGRQRQDGDAAAPGRRLAELLEARGDTAGAVDAYRAFSAQSPHHAAELAHLPARHGRGAVAIELLRRRRTAELLGRPLAEASEPPKSYEPEYLPVPCVLTVEQLVDFPYPEELPSELRTRLDKLIAQLSPGGDPATRVPGWKLGGRPTWHLNHPHTPTCESCGRRTELLLTIASDGAPGVCVERSGELRVFGYPGDHAHPLAFDLH